MIIKFNNDFQLVKKVEKGRANIICGAIDTIRSLWWKQKIIIIKMEKIERNALNQYAYENSTWKQFALSNFVSIVVSRLFFYAG